MIDNMGLQKLHILPLQYSILAQAFAPKGERLGLRISLILAHLPTEHLIDAGLNGTIHQTGLHRISE